MNNEEEIKYRYELEQRVRERIADYIELDAAREKQAEIYISIIEILLGKEIKHHYNLMHCVESKAKKKMTSREAAEIILDRIKKQ